MRNKILLTLITMIMTVPGTAQIISSNSAPTTIIERTQVERTQVEHTKKSRENIISASYDIVSFADTSDPDYKADLEGFSVEYSRNVFLGAKAQAFVNFGLQFAYSYYKKDYVEDYYASLYQLYVTSLSIPVNLGHKFFLGSKASFSPYLGLSFKLNMTAVANYQYKDSTDYYSENKYSLFDSSFMGDYTWNRVQLAGQIGARLAISKVFVGFEYNADFTELCEDSKSSRLKISLGCAF